MSVYLFWNSVCNNLFLPWRDQSNSREEEKPWVTSQIKAIPFTIFSVARCATINEIKRKNYWPNQIKKKNLYHIYNWPDRRQLLRIEILAFKSDLLWPIAHCIQCTDNQRLTSVVWACRSGHRKVSVVPKLWACVTNKRLIQENMLSFLLANTYPPDEAGLPRKAEFPWYGYQKPVPAGHWQAQSPDYLVPSDCS